MESLLIDATLLDAPHAAQAELGAYAAAARRGDVLPVCMRLSAARADAQWGLRTALVRAVGPHCPEAVLERACAFMPDAPEPRLLRASRAMAGAAATRCCTTRRAWLELARRDLLEASRLDPMDPTARGLLADLIGGAAWAFVSGAA
jgi:hypothetical protein